MAKNIDLWEQNSISKKKLSNVRRGSQYSSPPKILREMEGKEIQ